MTLQKCDNVVNFYDVLVVFSLSLYLTNLILYQKVQWSVSFLDNG